MQGARPIYAGMVAFGWPRRSMMLEQIDRDNLHVIKLGWNSIEYQLPWRVDPTGFALDSALFGAAGFAMAAAPGAIRRIRRRRRNACAGCGYGLGGLVGERCPEWGLLIGRRNAVV